jgi:hypothetical protein
MASTITVTSQPEPPARWTRAELVQELFAGNAEMLERAEVALAFPKASGFTFGRNGQTSFWLRHRVQEWSDTVRAVEQALRQGRPSLLGSARGRPPGHPGFMIRTDPL